MGLEKRVIEGWEATLAYEKAKSETMRTDEKPMTSARIQRCIEVLKKMHIEAIDADKDEESYNYAIGIAILERYKARIERNPR